MRSTLDLGDVMLETLDRPASVKNIPDAKCRVVMEPRATQNFLPHDQM
jgi:hypothetical protein